LASILLGLLAALSWGAGDYSGAVVSRKTGSARATLFGETAGLIPLLIACVLAHEQPLSGWESLLCITAGIFSALCLVGLYKAFSEGQISISAPVSGLMAAAIPVVYAAITGGLPPITTFAGMALALVSIGLITQSSTDSSHGKVTLQTLAIPMLAGAGFGVYFIFVHLASHNAVYWPLFLVRLSGSITMLIYTLFTRQLAWPSRSILPGVCALALFDVGGNFLYVLAAQAGRMDVAVVLSSLYSGITVLLSWLFLREKITSIQLAGILAALGAIALMTI
jgi:drug/metabolite transporter (DMT)-like permease